VSDADSDGDDGPGGPDRPPMLALLESLGLYRNARIGAAAGLALGAAAYLFRIAEPWGAAGDAWRHPVLGPEGWFLLLAAVLAVAGGMLVTIGLTVATAVRRIRAGVPDLDPDADADGPGPESDFDPDPDPDPGAGDGVGGRDRGRDRN